MQMERRNIWEAGEYGYPLALGFEPNLMVYLEEEKGSGADDMSQGSAKEKKPVMLVVPGGGYCFASPTEGGIVAKRFTDMEYQTFVLTYTTNPLMAVPLEDQPMRDLSRAIRHIRKHAEVYGIDPDRLAICGFSAGAHLCGSVCVHYRDVAEENPDYAAYSCRPDAAILSYPVITSGAYAHQGSFQALVGKDIEERTQKLREYFSLERHVTSETPPCFIWQTVPDATVPVENSYLFAEACKKQGVPYSHHVFSYGWHGLSLADDTFTAGDFGDPYPMEQMVRTLEAARNDTLPVFISEEEKAEFLEENKGIVAHVCRKISEEFWMPEVAMWPYLAEKWLACQWKSKE
ncbi:alpha/beta hydrolase [Roseburia hominis]